MRAAHQIHVYEERLEACIAARRVSVEILFRKAKNMEVAGVPTRKGTQKSLFLEPSGNFTWPE
jgi:hypothetical protein